MKTEGGKITKVIAMLSTYLMEICGDGYEGRKGQRERARVREKTGTGRQTDRPTRMNT